MPFVESRRGCRSRACYRPHHHPTYSIGAVDDGRSVFASADAGPVELSPGTLVFVPAARVHACNPAAGTTWSYQMLHLDADWLDAVRQEYADAALSTSEPVCITKDQEAYARFCRLNAFLFSNAEPSEKEAALIEFIGDFDAGQGLRIEVPNIPSTLAERIRPALDRLSTSPTSSITLNELARLAGLGRYQTIRAFRAVTGMTPRAWQLNERINLARRLLRDGSAIATVALNLGFADQAHFQRVFKAYAGVTPGCFRG